MDEVLAAVVQLYLPIHIFLGNKFALFTECVDKKKRTLKKFALAQNSQ